MRLVEIPLVVPPDSRPTSLWLNPNHVLFVYPLAAAPNIVNQATIAGDFCFVRLFGGGEFNAGIPAIDVARRIEETTEGFHA